MLLSRSMHFIGVRLSLQFIPDNCLKGVSDAIQIYLMIGMVHLCSYSAVYNLLI